MNRTCAALLLLLAVLTGCNRSAPANVAATVNGRAITYAELDKQFQSQFGGQGETQAGDQRAMPPHPFRAQVAKAGPAGDATLTTSS